MSSKTKSNIWKYFKLCVEKENEHKAECTLCDVKNDSRLIVRGSSTRNYSTKPLWNHMKFKHPNVEIEESRKVETESEATKEAKGSASTQPTVMEAFERSKMWSLEDRKSQEITKAICEMMALDAEPFAMVEREGFKSLLSIVAPRYPIPCRTHFSRKVLPELCDDLKLKIRTKLSKARKVSFTTDIWTYSGNNEAFISLTAHFITPEDMKQHIFTLATRHFPDAHSGSNIAEMLNQIIEEWGLESDQLHLILRDNAANIVVGTGMTEATGISCFIHTLQLVIHDAIFSQRAVSDIIAKCRKIVTHFSHSAQACNKLKTIQESLSLPTHKLVQDVSTRWNSTYYMLERLHEQRQVATLYAADQDIPTLGAYNWGLVENIIRVLKPFEEITLQASNDKELISFVIPAVATLLKYLSKRQKDAGVQTVKDNLKEALEKRFTNPISSKCINLEQKCFTVATLLDPRYKLKFLKDAKAVKEQLVEELIEHEKDLQKKDSTTEEEIIEEAEVSLAKEIHEDIWECFNELVAESSGNEGDSVSADETCSQTETSQASGSSTPASTIPKQSKRSKKQASHSHFLSEIERYLSIPMIERTEDPLKWWCNYGSQFQSLKPMVLKYLSAPPSSVASERLFSAAGQVYSDNRSKLLPSNAEKLIFVMRNLKYTSK